MGKKLMAFVPLLILILLFLGMLLIFGSLPEFEFYLYLLVHLIAGLCILKGYKIGVLIGILFGLYFCHLSRYNWKTDGELYLGIFYILFYLGLYFIFFKFKKNKS